MAISPTEVMTKLSEKDSKILEELEADIDNALRDKFDGVCLSFNLIPISKRVSDELINRYKKAGWDVIYQSDQRDGCYLQFKIFPITNESYYRNP